MHGNLKLYRKIREIHKDKQIILLGDLLDSWIFSIEDQVELVGLVLGDVDSKNTVCLLGNHELSYLKPKKMRCSGYNSNTNELLEENGYKAAMLKLFKPFLIHENILFTHAGFNNRIFHTLKIEPTLSAIKKALSDSWKNETFVLDIGYSRGGRERVGGIFWSDWNEDFSPIDGISQICGHTPSTEIRKIGNNWCIDCLPSTTKSRVPIGLLIDGGNVEQIRLDS